jgi:surfactin family lipopeptide synthetase A
MILNSSLQDLFLRLGDCTDRGITFINSSNEDIFVSYKKLNENSKYILGAFQKYGLKEGDELVFQLQQSQSFIETFWACILGKIIPVPVNFAVTNHLRTKLYNVVKVLNSPYLITTKENFSNNLSLEKNPGSFLKEKVIFIDDLKPIRFGEVKNASVNDIAYIQFSSGSTGNPKGVILTHGNLITNINSIHEGINSPKEGDKFLSWMPLTHDMGLIGFHLTPLVAKWDHYIMPTELFMRNPSLWLRKISDYKITFSSSPNFGYQYLLKHFRAEKNQDIDLSSLRIIVNGAEPISLDICERFINYFKDYGIKSNTIFPVYGLAEASLAATFSIPEEEIFSIEVNRNKLNIGDEIELLQAKESCIQFVAVGQQIQNTYLRLVDKTGNTLGDNFVGKIQIKGDNVTSGYYNNKEATSILITSDGWLNTGDLGFKDIKGNLYIVGRDNDIIFVNGGNFYSHDLERIAEKAEGIELGKIVIAGAFNSKLSRDEIIAFVLFRGKLEDFITVVQECQKVINEEIGITLDQVVPVKSISKTTSGKVQRYKLLGEYLKGEFDEIIFNLDELINKIHKKDSTLPTNIFEENILQIWQQILDRNDIGINDDFFILGGNSLKAGHLVMSLQEELNLDVSLECLYRLRTIHELSKLPQIKPFEESEFSEQTKSNRFVLSQAQNRIFYHYHLNKDSVAYNIPQVLILEGQVNISRFKTALIELVKRYDILRTTFHFQGDSPYQQVHEESFISLEEVDLDNESDLDEQLVKYIVPFKLETLPLIRMKYGYLKANKTVLIIDIHHILADGKSVIKLIQEFFKLYSGEIVKTSDVQYIDHVLWEEKYLNSDKIEGLKDFWLRQFNGNLPQLTLPFDFLGLKKESDDGSKHFGILGKELNHELELLSQNSGISKPVILFACYSLLLYKLTGQEDLIIGIAESGRNHLKFIDSVGMFVNNLPIRFFPEGNMSINQYLIKVNKQFIQAFNYKALPYSELLNTLNIKNTQGRNPLFDTMFVYQNMEIPDLSAEGLSVTHYPLDPKVSKFDLTLEIIEGEDLRYTFEYSGMLFKEETISRFSGYFETIVKILIENQKIQIKDLDILSDIEKTHQSSIFNETDSDNPRVLIYELFEQQVLKTPDSHALVCGEEKLTYKDLNQKAEYLASILQDKGIHLGDFVVILADQSFEFVISVLAVLKTGAVYIPIDQSYPLSRKDYIIKDCKAKFILTTKSIKELNKDICSNSNENQIIAVDELDDSIVNIQRKDVKISPDNLAYMIYTSGTSGQPKGAMIEHRNLLNYIWWAQKVYVKEEQVNFPLFTSVAFDLTVTSIFTPLITGNTLVIYSDNDQDLLIEKILMDDKVGVIKLTPSHLRLIKEDHKIKPENIKNLKRFIVGGEGLNTDLAQAISTMFNNKVEIYNEYGPTETTVGCMIYQYDHQKKYNKSVPIGKPADNAKIFLLDKYLKPVSQGVIGEVFIAGDGVGRGYYNKENLTEEKFILAPEILNRKLYRSGDLGRFVDENNIEFIGRSDQQVKINGYRIELDEIELCIGKFEGVRNAVVLKRDYNGSSSLCTYYVTDKEMSDTDLCEFLHLRLPHYMVPSLFFNIEEIPLTKNGKVDRDALSAIDVLNNTKEHRISENEIQELLIVIFQDVLNVQNIGIDDNFFELGGDSIKAVQITSRLYDKGILLNVKDILTHQTISQISLFTEPSEKEYNQGIASGEKLLTPIENWFFDQKFEDPNYFNQSVLLEFKKNIDKNILEQVFNKLIEHHDGLRLNYNPDKKCMFINNEHLKKIFEIDVFEIDDKNTLESIGVKVKSSFYITSSLLLKAAILKESGVADRLLITAHHLVIDGVSWRIMLEDLYNLYSSLEDGANFYLPKKTGRLIDWQNVLNEYYDSQELKAQIDYWNEIDNTEFNLLDETKIQLESDLGSEKCQIILDKEKTEYLLKDANKSYNTDIQILLLTALTITLKEWIQKDYLVIEMENYGRNIANVDVSRTIGWFTSMYPVCFEIGSGDIDFIIKEVKEKVKKVPDNGIGYGVTKYLNVNLPPFEKKKSEIRFNYLGQFGEEVSNNLFLYSNEFSGSEVSEDNRLSTNLEINSYVINGELSIEMSYNKSIFLRPDINAIKEGLEKNINQIIFHLTKEDEIYFTSSDFDTVELDETDFSNLLN